MEKGEYRAACAEHGIIFIAPDTSPRGEGVPDDEAYDFGQGAGFYVDATQAPWAANFRMRSYIERHQQVKVKPAKPHRHLPRPPLAGFPDCSRRVSRGRWRPV